MTRRRDASGHGVTRLTWLKRVVLLIVLGLSTGFLAVAARGHVLRRQMLVGDPDAIPSSHALFRFAVAEGRPAYQHYCADCHGTGGQGDRVTGAPSLADDDWLYGTGRISEIEWTITHGIRAADPRTWNLAVMPAFGTPRPSPTEAIPPLSPDDIRDVVEYLMEIGGHDANASAAARGDQIFHERGGCYDCHGADAHGDPGVGSPNLTDAIWLTGDGSRSALFTIIARGRKGVCPAWGNRLDAATIRSLAVYVYALSHKSATEVQ